MKVLPLRHLMLVVAVGALMLTATGCSSLGLVDTAPASLARDVVQTMTEALSSLQADVTAEEDEAADTLTASLTTPAVEDEVNAL